LIGSSLLVSFAFPVHWLLCLAPLKRPNWQRIDHDADMWRMAGVVSAGRCNLGCAADRYIRRSPVMMSGLSRAEADDVRSRDAGWLAGWLGRKRRQDIDRVSCCVLSTCCCTNAYFYQPPCGPGNSVGLLWQLVCVSVQTELQYDL